MRRIAGILSGIGLYFLYFFGLTRTGLVGPDEPRYAAIGRAMAATGDWITPRLWGQPWFEKPALLYWMTAAGFKLGLGPDMAPRFPVALASVAFLVYFFFVLRREFGDRAAWYSATILATSAGWLAYSHVAITDLPMSAAFAAAMLALVFSEPRTSEPRALASVLLPGVFLGLAILAKGLVPLVLFIPALWFLRHHIRDLAILFGVAALISAPWYILVTLRNGTPFLEEFFWRHHFGRFLSSDLQHGQPIWFYVPVLLAGLFPWIPLLALLFNRRLYRDRRAQFLLAWFAWGFVFFSVSRNKLPGYLLPLLPPLAALMGIALWEAARARILLAACGLLFFIAPPLIEALPQALVSGISHVSLHFSLSVILGCAALAAGCAVGCAVGRKERSFAALALLATAAVIWVVWRVYPVLDRQVSARALWLERGQSITCLPPTNRSQRYGIDYYVDRDLPDCK